MDDEELTNPFSGMTWKDNLQCALVRAYSAPGGNSEVIDAISRAPRIHLAVMREPWLGHVVSGVKDIESRWSKNRCAPYGQAGAHDIVVWKATSGPVAGVSLVLREWSSYLAIGGSTASEILHQYHKRICIPRDPGPYLDKLYCTLLWIGPFAPVPEGRSIPCGKRDRSGWSIVLDNTPDGRAEREARRLRAGSRAKRVTPG